MNIPSKGEWYTGDIILPRETQERWENAGDHIGVIVIMQGPKQGDWTPVEITRGDHTDNPSWRLVALSGSPYKSEQEAAEAVVAQIKRMAGYAAE